MDKLSGKKIYYHVKKLIDIKERGDTFPIHMTIGLTDYCNHRCIFCNSEFATADSTRIDVIDKDVLISFLSDAYKYGLRAVTICGSGEPLIYPDITSLLYKIKEIGLDIGIFTNGAKMRGEIQKAILDTCTFVRGSVNASNSNEHEKVHRVKGDFNLIVENFRQLVNLKKLKNQELPTIGTQFVFYDENYKSMVEAARLWKEVGVDYFEIKPLIEGEDTSVGNTVFSAKNLEEVFECMKLAKQFETSEYKVYAKINQYKKTIEPNTRRYNKCYGHCIVANLWSDGNIYFCQNHEHERDIIGNIYKQSFIDIWKGEMRKKRIEKINLADCPRACRCDEINETIWDYLHPNPNNHPNFV